MTAKEYIKEKRLSIGLQLESKMKIYLDTKYWIYFRDVMIGNSDDIYKKKLFEILEEGVKINKVICPFHFPIFREITKQTDIYSLSNSFQLIEKLSSGICLSKQEEITKIEIAHFFLSHWAPKSQLYENPRLHVWTKFIDFPSFSPLFEQFKDKQIVYRAWDMSLYDIFHKLLLEDIEIFRSFEKSFYGSSEKINKDCTTYQDEMHSFQNTILSEIAGTLDTSTDEFNNALEEIENKIYYQLDLIKRYSKEYYNINNSSVQILKNIVHSHLKNNTNSSYFSSIKIPATIHAAIRWDKGRKFKDNDFIDISHASGALPYHDIFLTEKSMCSLLKRSDIAFDKLYSCEVISSPQEACEMIENKLSS